MAIQYNPGIITDGLVLCLDPANRKSYPGSGVTWSDLSSTNSETQLINGVAYSNNNFGIFNLDGADDTIKLPFDLSYLPALSNFSLEIWLMIPTFPSALASPNVYGYKRRNGIVLGSAYYSGVAIYWAGNELGTSFEVFGYIRGNDGYRNTSNYAFSLNTWNQLTLVNNYSSSRMQFYVNGSFHSETFGPTEQYNTTLAPIAENIGISKPQVDGGGEFNYSYLQCSCSSAKIYKKALSAQEITQNFNALRGRFGI